MEKGKNIIIILLLALLLITIGYIWYDKIILNKSEPFNKFESCVEDKNMTTNVLSNYFNISGLKETEIIKFSDNASHYRVIEKVYFKDGKVYGYINSNLDSVALSNDDKQKIKSLPLENVQVNNSTSINLYKFPIDNVVLVDVQTVGENMDILLIETNEGKVYSFNPYQSGQSPSPFFNSNGKMNLVEETKFINIIRFGSYDKGTDDYHDTMDFYGIDINGNVIYK